MGGGDPIPLLKKSLLVGRRESCDIVLRFSNVSAHHCQLTVNGGYWHVRDLQSRNGVKVNGVRVTDKRIDPGDILSVAKHKYEVQYSPVDLGAVGPPPPEMPDADVFSKSLLERAGLEQRKADRQEDAEPSRTTSDEPARSVTTSPKRRSRARLHSCPSAHQSALGWPRRRKSAPTSARTAPSAPGPTDWTRQYRRARVRRTRPPRRASASAARANWPGAAPSAASEPAATASRASASSLDVDESVVPPRAGCSACSG